MIECMFQQHNFVFLSEVTHSYEPTDNYAQVWSFQPNFRTLSNTQTEQKTELILDSQL